MYRLSSALLFLLLFNSLSAQAVGTWMRSGEELYYRGGLSWSSGDQYWNKDSDLLADDCSSSNSSLSQTVEYGYNYYYTLIGNVSLANKNCGAEHTSGLGNLRLGIRGRLNIFRSDRTWEVTAIIPTGYSSTAPSRLGNGDFGIEAGIAGLFKGSDRTPISTRNWSAAASIRHWFGAPADQLLLFVRTSFPYETGNIGLSLRGSFSFRNETFEQISLLNQTRGSDYDEIGATLSWSATLDDEWRYRTSIGHTLWGRNTGHNLKIGFSIARSWDL